MRSSAVTVLTIVLLGGAACAAPAVAAVPSGPAQSVSTDPWSVGVPLPQPRADAAAEVFGTTLYVASGTDADHDATATVYAYSSATRTWRAEAPMPRPRAHFALLHVGSYLYAVGGGLTSVDRYDPAANRWAAGVVPAAPRAIGPAALATGGGLIEAFTTTPDGRAVTLTFDPAKNRWRQAPAVTLPGTASTLPGTASTQWSAAAPLGASDVMLLSPERIVDYSRSGAVTHYSGAAGATATFTFTGTSVAWLSECELARGSARVYVDGRDEGLIGQGCEDSLHGSGPVLRAVQSWPTAGRHTVRVVGTGGGAVVDVAGFAYLR